MRVAPRDGFRRRLYLSPLGVLLQLDGATFDSTVLTMGAKASSVNAAIRLRPVVASGGGGGGGSAATSTHAMLTMHADGADASGRRVRLRCSAPCGFEPHDLAGDASDVWRIRLGSPEGATLEVSAE